MYRDMKRFLLAACLVLGFAATAPARITRIVIERRESPAYRGQSFGEAGPYEWLRGRAYGELDPKAPLNAIITDLEFAPRNARGLVEYSATFTLAKPVDFSKASGNCGQMIEDFNAFEDVVRITADACIIGAGAAGITLAKEFLGTRFRVVLLESGGLEKEAAIEALNQGEVAGLRYGGMEKGRVRGFGGTTVAWRRAFW